MQSDLPWNISGISTEAREAARAAARREGLSLGQWLSRRITQSAPAEATTGVADEMVQLQASIDALRSQLERQMAATETAQTSPAAEDSAALSRQLEALRTQQQDFAEQMNAKMSVLAGTLTQIGEQRSPSPAAELSLTEKDLETFRAHADGRVTALCDSFVSLSGSMDLLRRDFHEAMGELGSHLSDFDERLRQIEQTFQADHAPLPAAEPSSDARIPDTEAAAEDAPLELSETAEPDKDTPAPHSFTLSEPPEEDSPMSFSAQDTAENRTLAAEARLDVPWRSADYDDEEEDSEERRHRVITIILRLALMIAVILAAAAGTMAYRHISFADLKAAVFHTQQSVPAPQPPPPVSRHTAADIGTLTDLAKNGNSQAMLLLGIFYADGTDVPANAQTAVHWLSQASSAGEAIAQYRLGIIYEGGHGIDAAPDKAAVQFSLAAKAGNLQAMYLLASAFSTGTGVDHNAAEAAHWYQKAANYGLADAALNLAQLYEQGDGVEADPVLAYKWYMIAAAEGDNDADPRLQALTAQLSAVDLTRAREAAKAFRPAEAPLASNQVPDIASVLHGGEN